MCCSAPLWFHTSTTVFRGKSEVLDDIMTWRTSYLDRHGSNPTQEDITKDEKGLVLLQEWQELEQAEETLEGDVMPLDPAALETKQRIQGQLAEWRTKYEEEHQRKPTRQDLFEDEHAANLFQQFSSVTAMEWPADMRLLLTTKIEKPF